MTQAERGHADHRRGPADRPCAWRACTSGSARCRWPEPSSRRCPGARSSTTTGCSTSRRRAGARATSAGAGDAAIALVDRGREDVIALVIAAEAIAAAGRPTEARRLANRAIEATGEPLDAVFAGMPRSAIWPVEDTGDEAVDALIPGSVAVDSASPAAVDAFASGRAALAAGDSAQASLRLAVALRLEPGFAESVLESVGPHVSDPSIALVAGDALRLLGRETEARAAYDVARGAASPSPTPSATTAGDAGTSAVARPADDAVEDSDTADDEGL